MKELWLDEARQPTWREVEPPRLSGDDVLVRPVAVAACDADAGALRGEFPLPPPYVLGHEFVGEVVERSDNTSATLGELVAVPFQISCGSCPPCEQGRTGTCTAVPRLSMYGFGSLGGEWGGGFADLVRVPYADHMLVRVPEDVGPAAAANAADNLADAWRCVAPWLDDQVLPLDVLVAGGGGPSIGLWAAELAVRLGANIVHYLDTDQVRLSLAEEAGAVPVEGPLPRRFHEHHVTVDATGCIDGLACCLRSTTPDGTCVSASIYFEDPRLPLLEMYSKNVTLVTGRPHSRTLLPRTLEAIATGVIDPLRISTVVDWKALPDALRDDAVKTIALRE